jgi:hypothetical protein
MSNLDESSSFAPNWGAKESDQQIEPGETNDWRDVVQSIPSLETPASELSFGCAELECIFGEMDSHNVPKRRQLWGCFWYERELAILAGRTGSGKSALAMQIALSIASGEEIGGFGSQREPQAVLYIDLENEIEDHIDRMGHWDGRAKAKGKLYRGRVKTNYKLDTLQDDIIGLIMKANVSLGVNVIILDNISWLLDFSNTRKDIHERTAELMQRLDHLSKNEGIAILVVAHTTKSKTFAPFELGDIAGSSSLQKYVRSIFVLGEMYGQPSGRYIKQLKSRQAAKTFSHEVAAFDLRKQDGLLHLVRMEGADAPESNFLKVDLPEVGNKTQQVAQYIQDHPSASTREIAEALGVSQSLAQRVKNNGV